MPLDAEATWDLSCPDWEQRLREGRSLVPDLPLDVRLAARAVGIFNKLRLYDVIGNPAMAEVAGEWWRDIVRALFGSLDPETGIRRVRGLFCMVPKKNAKTTNAAGLMLTGLVMNKRPSAEMLLTGPSQEITEKGFATIKGMIANDPANYLQKRFHVANHTKTITDRTNEALLKVKTFDEDIVTGAVVAAAAIDEIHLLGRKPRAAWIIQQLRGGMVQTFRVFGVKPACRQRIITFGEAADGLVLDFDHMGHGSTSSNCGCISINCARRAPAGPDSASSLRTAIFASAAKPISVSSARHSRSACHLSAEPAALRASSAMGCAASLRPMRPSSASISSSRLSRGLPAA